MLAFFKMILSNVRDNSRHDLTNLIIIFLKPPTFHHPPKNSPIINVHGTRGSCAFVCAPPAVVVRDTADKSTNIWRSQTSATSRAAKNLKNDDRQAGTSLVVVLPSAESEKQIPNKHSCCFSRPQHLRIEQRETIDGWWW